MPVPSPERRKSLEQARKQYQQDLMSSEDVSRYLTENRGLSWETITHFRLGVVGNPSPEHDDYRGMLAIPYMAPNGDTLSIRFRNLSRDGPKYRSMPGDKPRPYNTSAVERAEDYIVLAEGEMDTMSGHQVGLPTIGVPGANCWKPEWAHIFHQYRRVIVPMHGDPAGRKFGASIAEKLSNTYLVDLGDGNDMNSIHTASGPGALREKLAA
ncbi:hypothetical protein SAMN05421505_11278 [Sinosporangium album]|uniref:DNA primase n=1 Tax=Sinosporangium album TaxID=504805 RepID=A0A1G8AAD1_9ACTN|nr:toprim domain-containing protein [Sinosporangium album]SDH17892.1 hypothetical protein SAMN05421505_11278 [Sinosporangium album]